ncbi:MAG TPA: ABC transporter permease [Vicinamibacterales bacterium]
MDALRQDLRFATRMLRKDPAYAAAVVLTLAVCLGATTAIYTVVRSVLQRPLPYPEPERLVFMYDSFPGAGVERAGTSVPNHFDRLAMTDVFEATALYQRTGRRVGSGAGAEGVSAMAVTPSFFRVLRTQAARGRLFTEQDGTPGSNRVVVLSHEYAARQPGGIDGVIGRQLRLDDVPHEVIGVAPEGFTFLSPDVRLWVPLAFTAEERSEEARHSQNHDAIARLAAGVTIERAQARVDALNAAIVERSGVLRQALLDAGYHSRIVPLADDLVRNVRPALRLLWGGVLLVLLIAAVNIANLSLVRASARQKELATRNALGAGRGRVARLLVTESLLLTILGGGAGLLVGYWSLDLLAWLALSDLPRAHEIRMDTTVLAFTFALAVLLGVLVGAAPALQLTHVNLSGILREEGRGGTAGRGARYVRRAFVVSQVALAFVLLLSAGLLLVSFQRLLAVDPGFSAEHVLTGHLTPIESRYPDDAALRAYAARVVARLRSLPGVEHAGVTSFLPFSFHHSSSVIIPEGYVPGPGESVVSPHQLYVTAGYLEAMRVPLRRGRFFTDSDTAGAPRVIIIDERLAERFWPGLDPIGRRMYQPQSPEDLLNPGPDTEYMQVVGVVAPVKLRGLVEGEDARAGAYYIPYDQSPRRSLGFAIRTHGDGPLGTAAVQRALAEVDPETQPFDMFAMSERIERSLNPRRAPMLLSVAFGAVALLLAAIGLYGVLAYQVAQRTREIGIRMALGSEARGILRLVLSEGALLVALGLTVGFAGAVALRGAIASQLYGVGTLDPTVLLIALGVLAMTALVASFGPARRATRVNPVIALSQE